MKKLYMIELEELTCCGNCKFRRKGEDSCSLYSEFKGCPLIELKPKELVWEESNKSMHTIEYKSTSCYPFKYEYSIWHDSVEIYLNRYKIESLPMQDNVREKAEQFCQEHHNNLFWEMAGVRK